MKLVYKILVLVCALFVNINSFANDVWQWRGNDRTGVYPEKNLQKSWAEGGPKMLWSNDEVNLGFSAGSIVGNEVFICGTTEDKKNEILTVIDKNTGKTIWSLQYGASWEKSFPESRTMPAIVNGDLYVISGAGEVVCVDLKKRAIKWKVDAAKEFGGDPMGWGYGENVLVSDGKVFFTPGGKNTSMIALNAKDGKLLWKSESLGKGASYVSPVAVEVDGEAQIIGGVRDLLFGINPKNGKILWSVELKKMGTGGRKSQKTWEINCSTPIFKDGKVFLSAGYDYGCYVFEISKNGAKEVWGSGDMDTHHGGNVLLNGKVYGATWINNDNGKWACFDFNTGKKIYEDEWQGHSKGSTISADGMLYVYEEKRGDIALVNPANDKFDVVSSFKVPMGKGRHWCHIVIADGVMYVRRGDVLMAFDIKK